MTGIQTHNLLTIIHTVSARFAEQLPHRVIRLRYLELKGEEVIPIPDQLYNPLTNFRHFLMLNSAQVNMNRQGGPDAEIPQSIVKVNTREEPLLGHFRHGRGVEHDFETVDTNAVLVFFGITERVAPVFTFE